MMKKPIVMLAWVAGFSATIANAQHCLDEQNLLQLDLQYEKSLQTGDVKFLETLLAPEFYWVHNLASLQENKRQLIARMQKPEARAYARHSHDISLHRQDNTVVLQGLSSVEQLNPDGKTLRTLRYQFMRTYVEHQGECLLLAVQTMKVWSSEENKQ